MGIVRDVVVDLKTHLRRHSKQVRTKAELLLRQGNTVKETAEQCEISPYFIQKWITQNGWQTWVDQAQAKGKEQIGRELIRRIELQLADPHYRQIHGLDRNW